MNMSKKGGPYNDTTIGQISRDASPVLDSADTQTISRESTPLLITDEGVQDVSKKKHRLSLILPAVWMGSFLSAMDSTIVANIMSPIAAEFEQEDMKAWIATSFLLTNTAFQPLYGKISDIVGRKYALLFAQFFFGFGCLLSAFANSVPQFAYSRAVSGIGAGGVGALSSIIVSDVVSLEERGLFQGYANINYAVGQMIGGPLGGYLLKTIGWRWAFGAQAPALVGCMFLTYRNINIPPTVPFTKESFKKIDIGGSITLVVFISSILLLLSTNLNKFILAGVSIGSLRLFIYVERYIATERILPANLFNGVLAVMTILSSLVTFAIYSLFFGIPVYLQVVQDQNTEQSGRFLMAQVVTVSVGSVAAGYIIKKSKLTVVKTSIWITFSSMLCLLCAFLLVYRVLKYPDPYDPNTRWKYTFVLGLVLVGFGFGNFLVASLITIVAYAGTSGQAAATGLNYLFRSVGTVVGTGISLSLFEISLVRGLYQLLKDREDGESIIRNLLHNSNYLKSGDLSDSLKFQILKVYQNSMVVSFTPALFFISIAIVISGVLLYRKAILS